MDIRQWTKISVTVAIMLLHSTCMHCTRCGIQGAESARRVHPVAPGRATRGTFDDVSKTPI